MTGYDAARDAFKNAQRVGSNDPIGPKSPPPKVGATIEEICSAYPLNDFGNGLRFLSYGGREKAIFVPRVGWHVWSGRVWRLDEDKIEIRSLAQAVGARILDEVPYVALTEDERMILDQWGASESEFEALLMKAKDQKTASDRNRERELMQLSEKAEAARKALSSRKRSHTNHAKASGNTSQINNMLTEASVEVSTPLEVLNRDKLAINTLSGVVRLVQKEGSKAWTYVLEEHRRDHMISKMMPVEVDDDADCPTFTAFLERIMPSCDMREFLRRWFGYTLTGLTGEQKLVFAHGAGRNGKSTLVDAIAAIMADYATTVPIESLTGSEQRKGSDATPDLVRIPGARMVRASEPEHGTKMKEALIKALTGGEPILIRRMQQEFVEVVPEFKLTISGNAKPDIRGGDDGIWRRVLLVPFEEQIPVDEVDPLLPQKLAAERTGIFQWLLHGAIDYLTSGLKIPQSVVDATAKYREQSDPLRVFLLEECKITGSSEDFTLSRDLIEAFRLWQDLDGNEPWGKRQASNQLKARAEILKHPETGAQFHAVKRSDTGYLGIVLGPKIEGLLAAQRMGRNGPPDYT